jgi:hypothetical protein
LTSIESKELNFDELVLKIKSIDRLKSWLTMTTEARSMAAYTGADEVLKELSPAEKTAVVESWLQSCGGKSASSTFVCVCVCVCFCVVICCFLL